ncbi:uncharacterized protein DSM5745_00990 [Aspergillus mulundensis]|uniref:Uncharacterized protein n=1 Tax=Aspergillus mulundensis TaxID=1810919 RepID=A0A3D8T6M0_9EURO|nr:hypothetical protein DSM5745_00990 [Aspergillus mulundensis]RDW93668.1 hypothetical protein DSM5745_00990 [Aspergillus mulundensis]
MFDVSNLFVAILLPFALTSPYLSWFMNPVSNTLEPYVTPYYHPAKATYDQQIRTARGIATGITSWTTNWLRWIEWPTIRSWGDIIPGVTKVFASFMSMLGPLLTKHATPLLEYLYYSLPFVQRKPKRFVDDRMGIIFLVFFSVRYLRLLINLIAFWALYEPTPIPQKPTLNPSDCTVVLATTCTDAEDADFKACLTSCLTNEPGALIVVPVGQEAAQATNRALKFVQPRFTKTNVSVKAVEPAKRRAEMANVLRSVGTKITVLLDEHVSWPSAKFLPSLLAPFEDQDIGLVGVRKDVCRKETDSALRSMWNFFGALYLERHNFDIRAATTLSGGLFVSGIASQTSAFQSSINTDLKFQEAYKKNSFVRMMLRPFNTEEDFITRWIVNHGYKLSFQYTKEATIETTRPFGTCPIPETTSIVNSASNTWNKATDLSGVGKIWDRCSKYICNLYKGCSDAVVNKFNAVIAVPSKVLEWILSIDVKAWLPADFTFSSLFANPFNSPDQPGAGTSPTPVPWWSPANLYTTCLYLTSYSVPLGLLYDAGLVYTLINSAIGKERGTKGLAILLAILLSGKIVKLAAYFLAEVTAADVAQYAAEFPSFTGLPAIPVTNWKTRPRTKESSPDLSSPDLSSPDRSKPSSLTNPPPTSGQEQASAQTTTPVQAPASKSNASLPNPGQSCSPFAEFLTPEPAPTWRPEAIKPPAAVSDAVPTAASTITTASKAKPEPAVLTPGLTAPPSTPISPTLTSPSFPAPTSAIAAAPEPKSPAEQPQATALSIATLKLALATSLDNAILVTSGLTPPSASEPASAATLKSPAAVSTSTTKPTSAPSPGSAPGHDTDSASKPGQEQVTAAMAMPAPAAAAVSKPETDLGAASQRTVEQSPHPPGPKPAAPSAATQKPELPPIDTTTPAQPPDSTQSPAPANKPPPAPASASPAAKPTPNPEHISAPTPAKPVVVSATAPTAPSAPAPSTAQLAPSSTPAPERNAEQSPISPVLKQTTAPARKPGPEPSSPFRSPALKPVPATASPTSASPGHKKSFQELRSTFASPTFKPPEPFQQTHHYTPAGRQTEAPVPESPMSPWSATGKSPASPTPSVKRKELQAGSRNSGFDLSQPASSPSKAREAGRAPGEEGKRSISSPVSGEKKMSSPVVESEAKSRSSPQPGIRHIEAVGMATDKAPITPATSGPEGKHVQPEGRQSKRISRSLSRPVIQEAETSTGVPENKASVPVVSSRPEASKSERSEIFRSTSSHPIKAGHDRPAKEKGKPGAAIPTSIEEHRNVQPDFDRQDPKRTSRYPTFVSPTLPDAGHAKATENRGFVSPATSVPERKPVQSPVLKPERTETPVSCRPPTREGGRATDEIAKPPAPERKQAEPEKRESRHRESVASSRSNAIPRETSQTIEDKVKLFSGAPMPERKQVRPDSRGSERPSSSSSQSRLRASTITSYPTEGANKGTAAAAISAPQDKQVQPAPRESERNSTSPSISRPRASTVTGFDDEPNAPAPPPTSVPDRRSSVHLTERSRDDRHRDASRSTSVMDRRSVPPTDRSRDNRSKEASRTAEDGASVSNSGPQRKPSERSRDHHNVDAGRTANHKGTAAAPTSVVDRRSVQPPERSSDDNYRDGRHRDVRPAQAPEERRKGDRPPDARANDGRRRESRYSDDQAVDSPTSSSPPKVNQGRKPRYEEEKSGDARPTNDRYGQDRHSGDQPKDDRVKHDRTTEGGTRTRDAPLPAKDDTRRGSHYKEEQTQSNRAKDAPPEYGSKEHGRRSESQTDSKREHAGHTSDNPRDMASSTKDDRRRESRPKEAGEQPGPTKRTRAAQLHIPPPSRKAEEHHRQAEQDRVLQTLYNEIEEQLSPRTVQPSQRQQLDVRARQQQHQDSRSRAQPSRRQSTAEASQRATERAGKERTRSEQVPCHTVRPESSTAGGQRRVSERDKPTRTEHESRPRETQHAGADRHHPIAADSSKTRDKDERANVRQESSAEQRRASERDKPASAPSRSERESRPRETQQTPTGTDRHRSIASENEKTRDKNEQRASAKVKPESGAEHRRALERDTSARGRSGQEPHPKETQQSTAERHRPTNTDYQSTRDKYEQRANARPESSAEPRRPSERDTPARTRTGHESHVERHRSLAGDYEKTRDKFERRSTVQPESSAEQRRASERDTPARTRSEHKQQSRPRAMSLSGADKGRAAERDANQRGPVERGHGDGHKSGHPASRSDSSGHGNDRVHREREHEHRGADRRASSAVHSSRSRSDHVDPGRQAPAQEEIKYELRNGMIVEVPRSRDSRDPGSGSGSGSREKEKEKETRRSRWFGK